MTPCGGSALAAKNRNLQISPTTSEFSNDDTRHKLVYARGGAWRLWINSRGLVGGERHSMAAVEWSTTKGRSGRWRGDTSCQGRVRQQGRSRWRDGGNGCISGFGQGDEGGGSRIGDDGGRTRVGGTGGR